MSDRALRIGLLVESNEQLNQLRQLVGESGHQVACSQITSEFDSLHEGLDKLEVDAWLVTLAFDREEFQTFEELSGETSDQQQRLLDVEAWLAHLKVPVMIDDGVQSSPRHEEYQAWRRRILQKLGQLQGSINLAQVPQGAAQHIWVLAASTGGPEAVREFFQALDADLNIGFVYVQHMDSGYEQSLADIVNRHSHYPANPVIHGDVIHSGRTLIVANDHCVEFLANGTLMIKEETWPGNYSPSIDQVFANVARSFGPRCGVIVFSGMGEDGAAGARMVHQQGGNVWVQSPDSCTIDSMPLAAKATHVVTNEGTPSELAIQLTKTIRRQDRNRSSV